MEAAALVFSHHSHHRDRLRLRALARLRQVSARVDVLIGEVPVQVPPVEVLPLPPLEAVGVHRGHQVGVRAADDRGGAAVAVWPVGAEPLGVEGDDVSVVCCIV